jgi:SAM-dependent methyltransferase
LRYPVGHSGWSDDLTVLHESEAGDGAHYIDAASRKHAVAEIVRVTQGISRPAILEVGISSGYLLQDIKNAVPNACLLGSDYTDGRMETIASRMPDVGLLQFDLTRCPLPDGVFDVVVALNVLEHIEGDAIAAREMVRVLKPGGSLVIEVPAGPNLYDDYDRQLMHFRRYTMRSIETLLSSAGLTVERRSHLGVLLFPLFYAVKKANRLLNKQARSQQRSKVAMAIRLSMAVGSIGRLLMALEAAARRYVYLPFGIRCLVTARKPQS